ncbi:hypothetical protein [Streptomyces sp. S465]|uniref:hypothetical protein n=1 Tax=Streptomyces sp. S465 TaxID=2979468 RepID=UPI0022A89D82|nr:hypothetical protein [Streptomyces sp. S465]WAP60426.1 hypothetical protein N6H00_38685 [Streptomyces sp. S465]
MPASSWWAASSDSAERMPGAAAAKLRSLLEELVTVRNHPLSEADWKHFDTLQEEGIHQRDGGWPDERLLVQADYEVQVTDRRWLEHLRPGLSWKACRTSHQPVSGSPSTELMSLRGMLRSHSDQPR